MKIKIQCASDQNLIGVERIVDIYVESENYNDEKIIADKIFDTLAEKEYFTEDKGWKNNVKRDVAKVIKCDIEDIEVI